MSIRIPKYWMCQIAGWGSFLLIHIFFAFTFDRFNDLFIGRLLVFVSLGIIFSHVMRYVIIRSDMLRRPLQYQVIGVFVITAIFALFTGCADTTLLLLFKLETKAEGRSAQMFNFLSNSLTASFYLLLWNCIYFVYHYIDKSRKQQFDTLKLEALVKELEIKTIKSHINPHFIFNALNSVRALIDENPDRARTAITALSNILRSSMQAEKQETVPFSKELSIIKDYLALEHIRFDERLRIEYDIDENTLRYPVPPMMIQTLVENAIKHGISRQVAGGMVRVISFCKGNSHELVVQNTGKLNGTYNEEGFGLPGTRSRLYLMFGNKADFNIREIDGFMVQASVSLPLLHDY